MTLARKKMLPVHEKIRGLCFPVSRWENQDTCLAGFFLRPALDLFEIRTSVVASSPYSPPTTHAFLPPPGGFCLR